MLTIKESLEYDNIICEALFEKHMKKIVDQLDKLGIKPKALFSACGFMVDKVDASRVRVIHEPEESIKKIREVMEDNDYVVFAIKDDLVCCAWIKSHWVFLPTKKGHTFDSWASRRESPLYDWYESARSIKGQSRMVEHADEVWIVNAKGVLSKKELQNERSKAKYGVWENTPEYYAKVLEQNLARYKKKIQLMRMEKGSLFEKVVKDIEEFIPKVTTLLFDMHKNIGLGKWGSSHRISENISELNRLATNFLYSLNRIVQNKKSHEEWNRDGYSASTYNLRAYNEELDSLRESITKAQKLYNDILEMIKEFESKNS
jgi:hypothetical protein